MSKRRNDGDELPAKVQRGGTDNGDDNSSRKSVLKAHILGLNSQFASWIASQNSSNAGTLWTEGVKDYIMYAEELLKEFKDVVPGGSHKPSVSWGYAAAPKPGFSFLSASTDSAADAAPATTLNFGSSTPGTAAGFGSGFGGQPAAKPGGNSGLLFGAIAADKPAANGGDTDKAQAGTAPAKGGLFGAPAPSFASSSAAATKDASSPAFGLAPATDAPTAGGGELFAFSSGSEAFKQPASGEQAGAGAAKPTVAFSSGGPAASADTAPAATTTSSKPLFAFGGPAASADSAPAASNSEAGATATKSLFSFGKPASEPSTSLFAFGGTSAAASGSAAAPSMFSFGGAGGTGGTDAGQASTTSAPLFSFSAAPAPVGGGAAPSGEEADAEEEGPAKFESAVTVSEESGSIVFKAKSKFSHLQKQDGKASWESKGVGTFMLRTRNDESKKPFVTFTTEAGRVLYIANIPKTMTVIPNDQKNAVSFSAPWSPDGQAPPTSQGVMFNFPKGQHTVFKAALEKLQEAMAP